MKRLILYICIFAMTNMYILHNNYSKEETMVNEKIVLQSMSRVKAMEQEEFDIHSKLVYEDYREQYPACGIGKFKSYTDYRVYKNKTTAQYQLQIDKDTYTDSKGFRKYKDYYIVAVGRYYSDHVGKTFGVMLEDGTTFNIIVGDIKQDRHTDDLNCVCLSNGSVLEFIVDTEKLEYKSKIMGDVSYSGFNSNLLYIYPLTY